MGAVCAWPDCGPCAETCHGVDEDQVDDVEPAPAAESLAAGAIARGLEDAYTGYRARLARAVADMGGASSPEA